MKTIGTLHVLTDTVLQSRYSHLELARLAVAGGADTIQYRQKAGSTRKMIETASALQRLCADAGATLIVNDRVDVAIASGADGVHLGQDDFPLGRARDLLGPEVVIGGTAKTLDQVQVAASEGADYVGFGPIYPTGSKADAGEVKGLEGLARISRSSPIPVVAIGGIGIATAAGVISAGARGIAVISAVCCQDDPQAAAARLIAEIAAGRTRKETDLP
ncbi:MAG: thiamine phosphate synthase [Candidatus Latescibacteria bacterium]|jgi:thiamine-phosphate pyrophosphorylase|nr:thiamine phosphate synthase [Candidatus Latescibacterota bacterium]